MTLSQQLRELAGKATQGTWERDSEYDRDAVYSGMDGCGEGFVNYYIGADVGGKWKTLLDTVNSDHKLVEVDGDAAWDGIGQANVDLIVALQNNLPTILTALELQERLDKPETVEVVARAMLSKHTTAPWSGLKNTHHEAVYLSASKAAINALKGGAA